MNTRRPPSLIPYLDPSDGGFSLQLSLISPDPAILENTPFPFSVISDSDPLARLLEAEFVSDAGSLLKKVFVLLQRDQYLLTKDDQWFPNNRKIVESWQEAFSFYIGANEPSFLILLANQMSEKGKLSPFQSLFYCKTRKLFFHSLCPRCGLSLRQCEDEDLLARSGLQSYSASLKRYLYCPSCFSQAAPEFYAYELDRSDSPIVKDRRTLIKEQGLLSDQPNGHFPCGACPNRQGCYGSDQRVLSRIYPFAFYPFYLFVFDAMSLSESDFLRRGQGKSFFAKEPMLSLQAGLSETQKNDDAIRKILRKIVQKWRLEIGTEKEGWKKTVVISAGGLEGESTVSLREDKESEVVPETIILSPPGVGSGLQKKRAAKGEDYASSLRKIDKLPAGEDFSVQTVILRPGKSLSPLSGEIPSKEIGSKKTVLLSGEAQLNVNPKMNGAPSEDDVLVETIILRRDGK